MYEYLHELINLLLQPVHLGHGDIEVVMSTYYKDRLKSSSSCSITANQAKKLI